MLLAESPTLDRATKREFALSAAVAAGLTYAEIEDRAKWLRWAREPGYRALAAFANETGCAGEGNELGNAAAPGATLLVEGP
jgi:hypothetical protein